MHKKVHVISIVIGTKRGSLLKATAKMQWKNFTHYLSLLSSAHDHTADQIECSSVMTCCFASLQLNQSFQKIIEHGPRVKYLWQPSLYMLVVVLLPEYMAVLHGAWSRTIKECNNVESREFFSEFPPKMSLSP